MGEPSHIVNYWTVGRFGRFFRVICRLFNNDSFHEAVLVYAAGYQCVKPRDMVNIRTVKREPRGDVTPPI